MITRDDLVSLSEPKEGLAVSFYLPTQRAGKPTRENPIRMKNRIKEVRAQLDSRGWDDRDIDGLIAPALTLLEDYEFWQHQLDGLAMFMAEGEEHRLQVERDLPDLSVVGKRYHLKPLIPLLNQQDSYYVLAASLGKTRLFEVDRGGAKEIDLPEDTPRSLAQSLRFTDDDPDPTVRHQLSSRGQSREHEAASHGSGPEQPDRKAEILTFFRMLDNGVREVIAGTEKPLMFMGVEYLHPIYEEANHYPHLFEGEWVRGNPDQWGPDEIQKHSWDAVAERFEQPRKNAEAHYHELAGTGSTGDELEEVIVAGIDGRVDTLFVALDRQRLGAFDAQARAISEIGSDGDAAGVGEFEDLLDRAAVEALRTGAAVFPLPFEEMPSESELAAIYRY
ncbi:MAG: hypothetical protein WD273_00935 [Trueperaceae bacterium]